MNTTLWLILLAFGPAVATGAIVESLFKGCAKVLGTQAWLDRILPIIPVIVGVGVTLPLTPLVRTIVVDLQFGGERYLDGGAGTATWLLLLGLHGIVSGAISGQAYQALKQYAPEGVRAGLDWWRE